MNEEIKISEALVLRVLKGDVLQIVLKSDDASPLIVSRVRDNYQKALDALHGPGTTKVVVFGIPLDASVETNVVRKAE